jgi:hypothetical protein
MVTVFGLVRGLNTVGLTEGGFVALDAGGGLSSVPPSYPNALVYVGICVKEDASNGILYVNPVIFELNTVGASDDDIVVIESSRMKAKTASITVKRTLSTYIDKPVRGKEISQFGGMEKILDAGSFSSGTPDTATNGCGRLVFSIIAGSDLVGDVLITGDTVDRNTGAITAGDTETITLSGASTDTSDTDAQGNQRHAFSGAYITTKWFQCAITISTTEVDVSDFDLWNIAYHQFGDTPTSVEIDTFDFTGLPTNTAAWLYGYIYSLEKTNGTCVIERLGSIELPASVIDAANVHYRRKFGNIAKTLDPSTDGFWIDLFPGPTNQTYWEDMTTVMIYAATSPLTLS